MARSHAKHRHALLCRYTEMTSTYGQHCMFISLGECRVLPRFVPLSSLEVSTFPLLRVG